MSTFVRRLRGRRDLWTAFLVAVLAAMSVTASAAAS